MPGTKLEFIKEDGTTADWVGPRNRQEVKQWLELFFGLKLPDKAVCPGHVSPLDALCASYFAEAPIVIWKASRGLGGKTTTLAALSILELLDGADVVVLGGSARQSQRVHEVESDAWKYEIKLPDQKQTYASPLQSFLAKEPTSFMTRTIKGNKLIAIGASQRSVRGPHPQRLRLDEIDEMDLGVLNASLGQPMSYNGIRSQVTMSSTHQYPNGTMTNQIKIAQSRGFPVMEWCHRETIHTNGGWLSQETFEDTKARITDEMWRIEYDLQEPSITGRLVSPDTILKVFHTRYGVISDVINKYYEFEKPLAYATYATGADWAKTSDTTVITTLRTDVSPMRVVAWERRQKEPWPVMIKHFNDRIVRYPDAGAHDAIGVGSVVDDYITDPDIVAFHARGEDRVELYSRYLLALENDKIVCPYIESLVDEHKYVTRKDLFAPGGHPPDGLCSGALANIAAVGLAEDPQKKKKAPGKIREAITF